MQNQTVEQKNPGKMQKLKDVSDIFQHFLKDIIMFVWQKIERMMCPQFSLDINWSLEEQNFNVVLLGDR